VESRFLGLCCQRVKACKWCSQWLQAGGVRSGEGRREAGVQRESLAEKGGGAVTTVVERESGTGCLLVGREDREFVFS
jgi:hypothetical protein